MIVKVFKGVITVTKELYNALEAARSDDPSRYFMEWPYLDLEKNWIVATNGRSAFIHYLSDFELNELKGLETGYFQPVKAGKEYKLFPNDCDGTFPNVSGIIPEDKDLELFASDLFYFGSNAHSNSDSRFLFEVFTGAKGPIDISLLKPLKDYGSWELYVYKKTKGDKMVVFVNGNDKLFVMPMIREEPKKK